MNKILTLKEARKTSYFYHFYNNSDYEYKITADGFYHLIRNGKDLLEGKEAVYCNSYPNGDYKYKTEKFWHLIRNGIDLLEGKEAVYCNSYPNGDYIYETADGSQNLIKI